jgi:hypothetical protein
LWTIVGIGHVLRRATITIRFFVQSKLVNEFAVGSLGCRAEVEYPDDLLWISVESSGRVRALTATIESRMWPAAAASIAPCGW